jgi:Fungal specific transcription factor domain
LTSLATISNVAAASQPVVTIQSSAHTESPLEETTLRWTEAARSQQTPSSVSANDELRDPSPTFSTRPPSPKSSTDMVYADLFDNDRRPQPQSQTILYIGHATHNMTYILNHKGGSVPPFLHYPILDGLTSRKTISQGLSRGVDDWALPPKVRDAFIRTYFAVIHPTYPVVDRVQFSRSYLNQAASPSLLLLQAIYMVAATHCPSEVIFEAGFKSRHEAKRTFYRRGKELFDSDYEPNRLVNIQASFLFQFWWESPLEQKDATYWLTVCITLAQGCGMHRSTERSGLSINNRRLWRRIWASICVRWCASGN